MWAHVVVKAVILNHHLHKNLLIRRSRGLEGWESAGGKVEEGESLEEAIAGRYGRKRGLR